MAEFISVMGKWFPKKERIALQNKSNKPFTYNNQEIKPGMDFIYEGPDRSATEMLMREQADFLGSDFRHNPDFIQSTRSMGFNTVDDYLKFIGFNEKKELERASKLIDTEESHKLPEQRKEVYELGGGKDFSGNKDNDIIGGFGDERLRSANELRQAQAKA